MLQQTRVEAVIPYYERFLAKYPTPAAFAAASESEVLTAWAGLGYYSRARNLHKAAQQITDAGAFPKTYDAIHQLPGIGDYTAAAVSSIAFQLPHAALDGNVARVLARLTNDPGDIKAPVTRNRLQIVANTLVDHRHPGDFNQGMMELGALVCTPRDPSCLLCPIASHCEARRAGTERDLPIRSGSGPKIEESHTLLVILRHGSLLLRQRKNNSARLKGFWEIPALGDLPNAILGDELGRFRHAIVNHIYRFTVVTASIEGDPIDYRWTPLHKLHEIPLSTTAKKAVLCLQY